MSQFKKATLAAAMMGAALALPTASFAQSSMTKALTGPESGWYVGAHIGQSDIKEADDKDTSFKILGGYQINRNFAAEVGYIDFGSVDFPGGSVKGNALELVGVGILPINNQFSVYGKLGFARGEIKAGGVSDDSVEVTYGFGVQYDFNKNFGIRGEWQKYPDVGDGASDVDVLSVGVVYRFK